MKIEKIKFLLFNIVLSTTVLSSLSCNNLTGPNRDKKLFIENGTFKKVNTNSEEIKYAIRFTYYIKDKKCNWGGYSIQMDSQVGNLDLYKMQTMEPGIRYERADTFKVNNTFKTIPVVRMQGYYPGSSEINKELYAEYQLQPYLNKDYKY